MDLRDDDVKQFFAEADCREVNPPIPVETATWSNAGWLDWWVKERREWWGRVRSADGRQPAAPYQNVTTNRTWRPRMSPSPNPASRQSMSGQSTPYMWPNPIPEFRRPLFEPAD
jgi:hypothetical protein